MNKELVFSPRKVDGQFPATLQSVVFFDREREGGVAKAIGFGSIDTNDLTETERADLLTGKLTGIFKDQEVRVIAPVEISSGGVN